MAAAQLIPSRLLAPSESGAYVLSYRLSRLMNEEEPLLHGYEPIDGRGYIVIRIQVLYMISKRSCGTDSITGQEETVIDSFTMKPLYFLQSEIIMQHWILFIASFYRRFGVSDDVGDGLISDVLEFVKTEVADPDNDGKKVIQILVALDVKTIQLIAESFVSVYERAIRHNTYSHVYRDKHKIEKIKDYFNKDVFDTWLVNKEVDGVQDCSICMDSKHSMFKGICLSCNHVYHTTCIFRWILKNQTCPLCRSPVFSSAALDLIRYFKSDSMIER